MNPESRSCQWPTLSSPTRQQRNTSAPSALSGEVDKPAGRVAHHHAELLDLRRDAAELVAGGHHVAGRRAAAVARGRRAQALQQLTVAQLALRLLKAFQQRSQCRQQRVGFVEREEPLVHRRRRC
jgi:hypothetical protein